MTKLASATVHHRFASVLCRIAAATAVNRTRDEDAVRFANNGGSPADLSARMEKALPDLERAARRLEGR